MKLTTITHVSVDGVMQGLGGADEDRRGGFERGGWAMPFFGDEAATFLDEMFQRADAVLAGDVAAAVAELKGKGEGELQVHGSGTLVRWLLDNRLVDEITLLTYPLVLGQGTRLFPATGPDAALELVDSQATACGVTFQVYRPGGRPQYAA
jgi:hypothetical protein